MTDHYTHFDTRQFTEIREVQTKLLTGEGEKKPGSKNRKPAKGKGDVKQAGKRKPGKQVAKAGKKRAAAKTTA